MKRYAAEGVHDRVLKIMAAIGEKGDVLDIPTGQGALAEDLESIGFRVFAGDLARANIGYRNGRCVQFDLNDSMPIRSEAVDFVICVEGIEHIEKKVPMPRNGPRGSNADWYGSRLSPGWKPVIQPGQARRCGPGSNGRRCRPCRWNT